MTFKTTLKIVEHALWPRSLLGLVVAVVMVFGSFFLLSELCRISASYIGIRNWGEAVGYLVDIEVDGGRVRVFYSYKVDGVEMIGGNLGVRKVIWHDASPREIRRFYEIKEKSKSIIIRYDPDSKGYSTYVFDSSYMFLVVFIAAPPIILIFLFLVLTVSKILYSMKKMVVTK